MLLRSPAHIEQFVRELNQNLTGIKAQFSLSRLQCCWLAIVITGISVTGKLCWATFERRGLGLCTQESLRWMFCRGKIAWDYLLRASTEMVLTHYRLNAGTLIFDDTDKKRSKNTTKIVGVHRVKHKTTGGFGNGQELIFCVLVSDMVTLPVGFRFYQPDPAMTAWRKENKRLKRSGIPACQRPPMPKPSPSYPTKQALAIDILLEFRKFFPDFKVNAVLADALYSTCKFMDQASKIFGGIQVVSQIRSNQLVHSRGKKVNVEDYFSRQAGVKRQLMIRGDTPQAMTVLSARLFFHAHGKKRFIVAVKYEGEEKYRFLVASNLSWRYEDIIVAYTLRWLVEVFIEDWKLHEGWNKMTKHQGEKGSTQGVVLSLLCDHMLLLHPAQSARIKNKQPGMPVGCLIEQVKVSVLLDIINDVVQSDNPQDSFAILASQLQETLPVRHSKKHMVGRFLGRLKPTPTLKHKTAA